MKKVVFLLSAILSISTAHCQTAQVNQSGDCKDIQRKPDKFTGEIKLFTPQGQISFLKSINGKTTEYFCNITQDQDNIYYGRGVIIVLKDGTRINKPNVEVKVDVNTPRFRHSVFFKLTDDDLAQLSKSEITDVKMFTAEFSIAKGTELKNNLNCLLNLQ